MLVNYKVSFVIYEVTFVNYEVSYINYEDTILNYEVLQNLEHSFTKKTLFLLVL